MLGGLVSSIDYHKHIVDPNSHYHERYNRMELRCFPAGSKCYSIPWGDREQDAHHTDHGSRRAEVHWAETPDDHKTIAEDQASSKNSINNIIVDLLQELGLPGIHTESSYIY